MEIRRDQAETKGKKFHSNQTWVPLQSISPTLQQAVITAEDDGFYAHQGVEWVMIKEAVLYDLKKGKWSRGGSTITQQLAKNLYLYPSKNPLRKLRELLITIFLERILTKPRILELYLNFVEWGDGIFGAEAASQIYFKKSAAELTWEEAISLASVLPAPRKLSPLNHSSWMEMRKAWLRQRLKESHRMPVPEGPFDIPDIA